MRINQNVRTTSTELTRSAQALGRVRCHQQLLNGQRRHAAETEIKARFDAIRQIIGNEEKKALSTLTAAIDDANSLLDLDSHSLTQFLARAAPAVNAACRLADPSKSDDYALLGSGSGQVSTQLEEVIASHRSYKCSAAMDATVTPNFNDKAITTISQTLSSFCTFVPTSATDVRSLLQQQGVVEDSEGSVVVDSFDGRSRAAWSIDTRDIGSDLLWNEEKQILQKNGNTGDAHATAFGSRPIRGEGVTVWAVTLSSLSASDGGWIFVGVCPQGSCTSSDRTTSQLSYGISSNGFTWQAGAGNSSNTMAAKGGKAKIIVKVDYTRPTAPSLQLHHVESNTLVTIPLPTRAIFLPVFQLYHAGNSLTLDAKAAWIYSK